MLLRIIKNTNAFYVPIIFEIWFGFWEHHQYFEKKCFCDAHSISKDQHGCLIDVYFKFTCRVCQTPGHVVQWVTCLAADTCLAVDPGVSSLILAWSHTFVKIDHEIISIVTLLPSTDSRRVIVSYKQNYMQEVLVNILVKFSKKMSG